MSHIPLLRRPGARDTEGAGGNAAVHLVRWNSGAASSDHRDGFARKERPIEGLLHCVRVLEEYPSWVITFLRLDSLFHFGPLNPSWVT
jgi:hypothetical protein